MDTRVNERRDILKEERKLEEIIQKVEIEKKE
jgi:hypothetical protein